jgi:hypothetical protein
VVDLVEDAADELLRLRARVDIARFERLGERPDRRERGPQFVGDVAEEVPPDLVDAVDLGQVGEGMGTATARSGVRLGP